VGRGWNFSRRHRAFAIDAEHAGAIASKSRAAHQSTVGKPRGNHARGKPDLAGGWACHAIARADGRRTAPRFGKFSRTGIVGRSYGVSTTRGRADRHYRRAQSREGCVRTGANRGGSVAASHNAIIAGTIEQGEGTG